MGLTQAISLLVESRGINLADQHFERRVASCLCTVNAILDVAWLNLNQILETIDRAVKRVLDGNDDIVITMHPRLGQHPYPFVDLADKKLVEHNIEFAL